MTPRARRRRCDIGPVLLSRPTSAASHRHVLPTPTCDENHCSNTGPWEWAGAVRNAGGVESEI